MTLASTLIETPLLHSRADAMATPSSTPNSRGVYAWFFQDVPPDVPTHGCLVSDGLTLLYIGICPKNGNGKTQRTLRQRIRGEHYGGNAEGSTLRQTLGILLAGVSGFPLRRVGSGKRLTLTHNGERWLDDWMSANAFVSCVPHDSPWEVERHLLHLYPCPLNIQHNRHHPFNKSLRQRRREARQEARRETIADETGQSRTDG
jgi:hypothetical protein